MAIIFLFNVMVIRKSEINSKYPGGLAHFLDDWLAKKHMDPWCEDEHLIAFSSMVGIWGGVEAELRSLGIDVLCASQNTSPHEICSCCDWLDWDIYERIDRELQDGTIFSQEVERYWLKGTEPGEVVRDYSRRRIPNKRSGDVEI